MIRRGRSERLEHCTQSPSAGRPGGQKITGQNTSAKPLKAFSCFYLCNQLQVKRSGNLQLLTNGMDDHLDRLHRLLVEVLSWRHQSGVSRVNASILHMLRYRDGHHHPVAGYGIYIDLLKREIIFPKAPQQQELSKVPFQTLASCMNFEMTTGCSLDTATALLRYFSRSLSL